MDFDQINMVGTDTFIENLNSKITGKRTDFSKMYSFSFKHKSLKIKLEIKKMLRTNEIYFS